MGAQRLRLIGDCRLHPVDLGIRSRKVIVDPLLFSGKESGKLLSIGLAGQHPGEEALAALEQSSVVAGLNAHRGNVGLHLGDLPLHPGDIAVDAGKSLEGSECGPGQQGDGNQQTSGLYSCTNREAAQTLAIVKKNIARFEEAREPSEVGFVRHLTNIRHYYPRSAPDWDRRGRTRRPLEKFRASLPVS
ncbi:MAG: hypothetical protein ACXW2T_01670 [Allosphingosinicella sp.]